MLELDRLPARAVSARLSPAGFLAKSPLFQGLDPDLTGRIVRSARKLHVARGEVLYGWEHECRSFYFVGTGYVALSVQFGADHEKIIELLGPGTCFGGENMLAAPQRSVRASMLTDGVLVSVAHEAMMGVMDQSPQLVRVLLADLARRSLDLIREIEGHAMQCGLERVAAFLLRSSRSASDRPREVSLPVPKRVIASFLDLTKESFSRVLRELSDRELIAVSGRSIRLHDPAGLAQVCSRGEGCEGCWGCPRGGRWVA